MTDNAVPGRYRGATENLLFGLLALQNGFISRDVLIAAFGVSIAEKSKATDEILPDRGDLDADCHALLVGLVRQHIKLHGNDPGESLADVSDTGSVLHRAYADGGPLYAMRFIRGDSLKRAIARFHADDATQKNPGLRTLAL